MNTRYNIINLVSFLDSKKHLTMHEKFDFAIEHFELFKGR